MKLGCFKDFAGFNQEGSSRNDQRWAAIDRRGPEQSRSATTTPSTAPTKSTKPDALSSSLTMQIVVKVSEKLGETEECDFFAISALAEIEVEKRLKKLRIEKFERGPTKGQGAAIYWTAPKRLYTNNLLCINE